MSITVSLDERRCRSPPPTLRDERGHAADRQRAGRAGQRHRRGRRPAERGPGDRPGARHADVCNADGSFTYTPAADFFGTDAFTYTVNDAGGGLAVRRPCRSTVSCDERYAGGDRRHVRRRTRTRRVTSARRRAGERHRRGRGYVDAVLVTAAVARHADAATRDGAFTYTPATNFIGTDSFTYTVNDVPAGPRVGTVTVTVNAVNDAPAAAADAATTAGGHAGDASAALGQRHRRRRRHVERSGAERRPAHGTASLNADGALTYTPAADFNGTDGFTYTVSDGHGGASIGTVSIDGQRGQRRAGGDRRRYDDAPRTRRVTQRASWRTTPTWTAMR